MAAIGTYSGQRTRAPTSGCPCPSDTVKSCASTPPPPPIKIFLLFFFLLSFVLLLLFSRLQQHSAPPPGHVPPCWELENDRARTARAGNQRMVVPVPPVQGTRESTGLLWWTRPGTPMVGPVNENPGMLARARSAFYDGPKLRQRQTRELIYKMWSCRVKLDEENPTYAGLAQENGFIWLHTIVHVALAVHLQKRV